MQNDFMYNLYYIYLHRLSATIKGAITDATNQGTLNFSFLLKKKKHAMNLLIMAT